MPTEVWIIELITKFRMRKSLTKLDKDNGVELQTISDLRDNNKPKLMKYVRNWDSCAGLSEHQREKYHHTLLWWSNQKWAEGASVCGWFPACAERQVFSFRIAIGRRVWIILERPSYRTPLEKRSVCLGISLLKNILHSCVVQIHLETTKWNL